MKKVRVGGAEAKSFRRRHQAAVYLLLLGEGVVSSGLGRLIFSGRIKEEVQK